MSGQGGEKNGNLTVERGGLYGRPRHYRQPAPMVTAVDFQLDREMQTVFAALHAEDGTVPSRGIQEIREGRQWPWRMIARRFREAAVANVPESQLDEVIHVLQQFKCSLYRPIPQRDTAA
jgi:hypothetical protein